MINDIFNQSELALAAYAILDKNEATNSDFNLAALEQAGMTQTQAEQFAVRWPEVVDHYNDPVTDLSVTVFRNGNDVNIAIRGTVPFDFGDLWADLQLGIGQIPDQYTALKSFYETLQSSGEIQAADNLSVSGHSLGGFLAQLLAVDYAGDFDHTYTYNAPGIGGVSLDLFGIPDSVSSSIITNIRGDGFSAVATVGTALGTVEEIQIENSLLAPADHSIKKLTDTLLVFNTLLQLDTAFSVETYNTLFQTASNEEDSTLERLVESITTFFGNSLSLPSGDDNREALYQAVYTLKSDSEFQSKIGSITIVSTIGGSETISSLATSDTDEGRGYRYALVNFLPFAVTSGLSGTAADDPKYDVGNFSEQYLTDRAQMLSLFLSANAKDMDFSASVDPKGGDALYVDFESGASLTTGNVELGGIADSVPRIVFGTDGINGPVEGFDGKSGDDYLYAGGGDDELRGRDGNDYLEGGAGQDIIVGGKGNDRLVGGKDEDIFQYTSGDGNDGILDADTGGDRIQVNGVDLSGLTYKKSTSAGNVYEAENHDIRLIKGANGEPTIIRILENGTAGTITLNSYQDGDFGITLPGTVDNDPPAPPALAQTINSDSEIPDLDGDDDIWGDANSPTSGSPDQGVLSVYRGGALDEDTDDKDYLDGGLGDDWVSAGSYQDTLNSIPAGSL